MCTIKILRDVDTSLTGDYKIRAEGELEMFKNYTHNLSNFQLFITEVIEHAIRLVLPYTIKANEENCPAPSHGTKLSNTYPLQSYASCLPCGRVHLSSDNSNCIW